jgi:hypothetical protein
VHLGATAIGSALFGVNGAVAAFCVAPGCFAAVLLVAGAGPDAPRLAREMFLDGARFLVLSGLAFGTGWLVGKALPSELVGAFVAGALGTLLYVVGLRLFARRQVAVLLGAIARPAAASA